MSRATEVVRGRPPVFWQILDAAVSWLDALEVHLGLGERTYDHVDELLFVLLL